MGLGWRSPGRRSTRRGSAGTSRRWSSCAPDLWSIPVPMPPARCATSGLRFALAGGGLGLIDTGWDSDEGWDGADRRPGRDRRRRSPTSAACWSPTCTSTTSAWPGGCAQASGAWIAMHPADAAVVRRLNGRTAAAAAADEVDFLVRLGADPDEARADVGRPRERWSPSCAWPRPTGCWRTATWPTCPAGGCAPCTPRATPPATCASPRSAPGCSSPATTCCPGSARTSRPPRDGARRPAARLPRLAGRGPRPGAGRGAAGARVAVPRAGRAGRPARRAPRAPARRAAAAPSARHPGSTPWQLAAHLTWSRPWSSYQRRMRIFAVTETDAHLRLLGSRGLAVAGDGRCPPGRRPPADRVLPKTAMCAYGAARGGPVRHRAQCSAATITTRPRPPASRGRLLAGPAPHAPIVVPGGYGRRFPSRVRSATSADRWTRSIPGCGARRAC